MRKPTPQVILSLFWRGGDVCAALEVTNSHDLVLNPLRKALELCLSFYEMVQTQVNQLADVNVDILLRLLPSYNENLKQLLVTIYSQVKDYLREFDLNKLASIEMALLGCREGQMHNPYEARQMCSEEFERFVSSHDDPDRAENAVVVFIQNKDLQNQINRIMSSVNQCVKKLQKMKNQGKGKNKSLPGLLEQIMSNLKLVAGFIKSKMIPVFSATTQEEWLSKSDWEFLEATDSIKKGVSVSHAMSGRGKLSP